MERRRRERREMNHKTDKHVLAWPITCYNAETWQQTGGKAMERTD
jgi:hypothetical protein